MKKGKSMFEAAGFVTRKGPPVFQKGGKLSKPEMGSEMESLKKAKPEEKDMAQAKGAFIGQMFKMRDITHLLHLKSESYAEHKALNEFYDDILGYTDSVAEMMQSNGLLDIRIPASVIDTTPIDYISTFRGDVVKAKEQCMMDGVKAVLDEVIGLCDSTLYKLKFLK